MVKIKAPEGSDDEEELSECEEEEKRNVSGVKITADDEEDDEVAEKAEDFDGDKNVDFDEKYEHGSDGEESREFRFGQFKSSKPTSNRAARARPPPRFSLAEHSRGLTPAHTATKEPRQEDVFAPFDDDFDDDGQNASEEMDEGSLEETTQHEPLRLPRQLGLNAMKLHLMKEALATEEDEPMQDEREEEQPVSKWNTSRHVIPLDDFDYGQTRAYEDGDGAQDEEEEEEEEPEGDDDDEFEGDELMTAEYDESAATQISQHYAEITHQQIQVHSEEESCLNEQGLTARKLGGMSRAGSFRVGWGPRGTLAYTQNRTSVVIRPAQVSSTGTIAYTHTASAHQAVSETLSDEDEAPSAIERLKAALNTHKALHLRELSGMDLMATDLSPSSSNLGRLCTELADSCRDSHFHKSVFDLVYCLYVDFQELFPDSPPQDVDGLAHNDDFYRRAQVSDWLERTVAPEVKRDLDEIILQEPTVDTIAETIFLPLTGHQVDDAASAAMEARDFKLASLIALTGDFDSRQILKDQVQAWKESKVWDNFSACHQRIYQLLSGNVDWRMLSANSINSKLSWCRALGLHLWYKCKADPQYSMAKVLYEYENSILQGRAPVPLIPSTPPTAGESHEERRVSDVRYELIRLYAHRDDIALSSILLPENASGSLLDYHMPWFVHDLLELVDCPKFPKAKHLYMNFIFQLEAMGQWQWAVYIAMVSRRHFKEPDVFPREAIVRELLARNWPAEPHSPAPAQSPFSLDVREDASTRAQVTTEVEQFLLEIGVEQAWIAEAKALRCKYEGLVAEQLHHLISARDWYQAHNVLVTELAAKWIIHNSFNALEQQLNALKDKRIEGWDRRGAVYLEYIRAVNAPMEETNPKLLQTLLKRLQSLEDPATIVHPQSHLPRKPTNSRTDVFMVARSRMTKQIFSLLADRQRAAGAVLNLPRPPREMSEESRVRFLQQQSLALIS